MKFISREGELQDVKILASIKAAANDYEDGAIIEARNILADIVCAIDEWSKKN